MLVLNCAGLKAMELRPIVMQTSPEAGENSSVAGATHTLWGFAKAYTTFKTESYKWILSIALLPGSFSLRKQKASNQAQCFRTLCFIIPVSCQPASGLILWRSVLFCR